MARNLSRSRRKEIKAKKRQAYVLEHQRDLSEQDRKKFLLMLDSDNRTRVRSLERSTPGYGLRSAFGEMMRRVFLYSGTPMPACDIQHFRFGSGLNVTDDYDQILLRWHQARLLERAA